MKIHVVVKFKNVWDCRRDVEFYDFVFRHVAEFFHDAALAMDDPKSPRQDPRYAEMTDEQIPLTESLKDTIARLMPYYKEVILKAFENHDQVMVVAHGNSLRGIVKELRNMSEDEIIKFNIPTAIPYIFEFDDNMNLQNNYFLGDPEEIAKKMQSVANQGKAK